MQRQFRLSRRTRLVATAIAASVTLVPALPAGADNYGATAAPSAPPSADGSKEVTLVTGDVVRVSKTGSGQTMATVQRSPRSTGGVQTYNLGDDLYVVPDEVLPYLASGRLDQRLFDVTGLIDQGYDDTAAKALPLIATYGAATRLSGAAHVAPQGSKKVNDLPSINGTALAADKDTVDTFWDAVTPDAPAQVAAGRLADGITKLWLDGKVEANLAATTAQIGAPQAWAAGQDGTGMTVAVLDTGVDLTHPDLATQVSQAVSFVPGQDAGDRNGHGTHVASTIAGTGAASAGGVEKGVAPGAKAARGQGPRRLGLGPGLLDHRRHGLGRPPRARGQHEPRQRAGNRRHRPDGPRGQPPV